MSLAQFPKARIINMPLSDKNTIQTPSMRMIGLWKVAIDRHLVRIVVIDILFYFNLAAILE